MGRNLGWGVFLLLGVVVAGGLWAGNLLVPSFRMRVAGGLARSQGSCRGCQSQILGQHYLRQDEKALQIKDLQGFY